MIDINKQYTYNGKPVRIYADGSDTYGKQIHGAILDRGQWTLCTFHESDLVEVREPKKGELCFFWDINSTTIIIDKFIGIINNKYADADSIRWDNCAPFTGTLPEAFKGLV